jgi:hypothetical protein
LQAFLFFFVWYFFMVITAGCQIPSGLFVPAMVVGCAVGQLAVQWAHSDMFSFLNHQVEGETYEVLGASAMLAGFTRQTYSLAVIMLETTQQIDFFIPVMLTILVSCGVGKIFNQSLYERALRGKNLPLLRNHCPKSQRKITALEIMSPLVLTVEGIVSVDYLRDILKKPFNNYPVLNSSGNIVGMIPKHFLIVLLENHHWVDTKMLSFA